MKAVKILTVAALGVGLLAFAPSAHAGGKKGGGNSNGSRPKIVKGLGNSGGFHKNHHHHHVHIPVVRYRPALVVVPPPVVVVPAGTVMELPGFFGLKPGLVVLDMHGTIVHPKVLAWTPRGVVVELPFMKLPAPVCGKLVVIGWNKFAYRPMDVKIVPPLRGPVGGPVGSPVGGPAVGTAGAPSGPAVLAVK